MKIVVWPKIGLVTSLGQSGVDICSLAELENL